FNCIQEFIAKVCCVYPLLQFMTWIRLGRPRNLSEAYPIVMFYEKSSMSACEPPLKSILDFYYT
ncbi:hypothetical protein ACUX4R_28975, partial [Salmonella enterica]